MRNYYPEPQEELSPYEIFQMERFSNILPGPPKYYPEDEDEQEYWLSDAESAWIFSHEQNND